MMVDKAKFDSVPKEKIDAECECESCGSDLTMFEVTEFPLCDTPEWKKFFLATCDKCECFYLVKKNKIISSLKGN